MLSRQLRRAALAAGLPLSLLAIAAPPVSAAPTVPAAAGFSRSATSQLIHELRAALRISKGQGATVAVLADGVDPSAPGLAGVVRTGPSFGNVAGDSAVTGTVFASGVAGRGPSETNPAGTVGLAPATRILSIRIPGHAPGGVWRRDVGAAIKYAASHGAQVIYVNDESTEGGAALDSAVEYAAARNAVVISSEFSFIRGFPNENTVPDSLPGVLGAASVVLPGLPPPQYRKRSPVNESILVSAPANTLIATGPQGRDYRMFNSLSAAAWLTATVALIKSVYPHLPPSLVDLAIARSARDHPKGGYSKQLGFGLLNPDGALHQAAALAKLPATAATGTGSLTATAHFGPRPGTIVAVHHSASKVAGLAGAMAAGLVLLIIAAVLAFSWRRKPGSGRKLENPTGA